jgi:hypothetical protein
MCKQEALHSENLHCSLVIITLKSGAIWEDPTRRHLSNIEASSWSTYRFSQYSPLKMTVHKETLPKRLLIFSGMVTEHWECSMTQCMGFKDGRKGNLLLRFCRIADETTLRQISYRFVSFFWTLIAGLFARAEGPHYTHCQSRWIKSAPTCNRHVSKFVPVRVMKVDKTPFIH